MIRTLIITGAVVASLGVGGCAGIGGIADWALEHRERIGALEKQTAEIAEDVEALKQGGVSSLGVKDATDVEALVRDVEALKAAHPEIDTPTK